MRQRDHRELSSLLTELISAQDNVTHWNEAGAKYTEGTRKMIIVRTGVKQRICSFVDSLVKETNPMNEYDLIDFNAESDDIERRLAQDGEELAHDGSRVHVDTAWATGFVNREGEPMH